MNAPENLIPSELKITAPAASTLSRGANAALDLVREFEITDEPTLEIAGEELRSIKKKAADLDEQRKALTKPLDDVKKGIMDLYRGPLELLGQAESILKGKILDFQREQQRIANEQRIAAERAAQEERERLEREAQALALAAEGKEGESAVKQQVAEMVIAAPIAAPAPAMPKGTSTRTSVEFEVDDLLKLVQHVAQNPELIGLLRVDDVKLRAYVRGLGMACKLPGVKVFEKQTLAARR